MNMLRTLLPYTKLRKKIIQLVFIRDFTVIMKTTRISLFSLCK